MVEIDVARMIPEKTYRVAFRQGGATLVLEGRYVGRQVTAHGETLVLAQSLPLGDGIPLAHVVEVGIYEQTLGPLAAASHDWLAHRV